MLPTFYCLGAQKAGTTWLYDCLAEHPDVCVPEHKEVNWFRRWQGRPSQYDERGVAPYEALFDGARGESARGDISPGLLAAGCAETLHELTPDATVLAIVRDPADRARSHYHMLAGRHRLPYDLDELLADPDRPDPHEILTEGRYAQHLAPFFERFGRVEVLRYEDLRASPERFFADVCERIGVDPSFRPRMLAERSNVAGARRVGRLYEARVFIAERLARWGLDPVRVALKRAGVPALLDRLNRVRRENPPLRPDQRARLVALYRDDVEALRELTGQSFEAWLQP